MPLKNREIAEVFERIAALLSIQGANPFRIRAYRNAATAISRWPEELSGYFERKIRLPKIPGIGKDLELKIRELLESGRLGFFDDLKKSIPESLFDLMEIAGLGPKRVKSLWSVLGVTDLDGLRKVIQNGRLKEIPGFGAALEGKIIDSIRTVESFRKRHLYEDINHRWKDLKRHFETHLPGTEVQAAGSFRRARDTIGDLDLLAAGSDPDEIIDCFRKYPGIGKPVFSGRTHLATRAEDGFQLDLRVVEPEAFGAALIYFTGSKNHNISLRQLAKDRGWKLSEYGLFEGKKRIAGITESEVYRKLGLHWIPPELREDQGELELAKESEFPQFLDLSMIRGDLHVHTTASDGSATVEQMVRAAIARKYEYLAITDHSKGLRIAKGLDSKRYRRQFAEIDRLNQDVHPFRILKGAEANILEDGSLDLPESLLQEMDIVIGSIHDHFRLDSAKQTDRILKAMDHPSLCILGHPTGRLIGKRDPFDVDLIRIAKHAVDRGVVLELNAQPNRMDLSGEIARSFHELKVRWVINTDAHSVSELDFMQSGVMQSRRGFIAKDRVLNAMGLNDLLSAIRKKGIR